MQREPSVAVVCLTPRGGHIEHAFNLSYALRLRGYDAVLVSRESAMQYLPEQELVPVVGIPAVGQIWGSITPLRLGLEWGRLRRLLASRAPVWVVFEEPHMTLAAAGLPTRITTIVHNLIEHDAASKSVKPMIHARIKQVAMRLSDRLVVHGEHQRQLVPTRWLAKVRSVPLPSVGAFESLDANEGSPLSAKESFVCIGEIRRNKNYEDAIHATLLSGSSLLIAGADVDKDYAMRLRELGKESGAAVLFEYGFLSAPDFSALLKTCRAVILPYSSFSAQSGVLERAIAAGAPVICADLPSLREQVNGRPGVVFYNVGDVDSLAAAMRTTAIGVGAREKVVGGAAWAQVTEAVVD